MMEERRLRLYCGLARSSTENHLSRLVPDPYVPPAPKSGCRRDTGPVMHSSPWIAQTMQREDVGKMWGRVPWFRPGNKVSEK